MLKISALLATFAGVSVNALTADGSSRDITILNNCSKTIQLEVWEPEATIPEVYYNLTANQTKVFTVLNTTLVDYSATGLIEPTPGSNQTVANLNETFASGYAEFYTDAIWGLNTYDIWSNDFMHGMGVKITPSNVTCQEVSCTSDNCSIPAGGYGRVGKANCTVGANYQVTFCPY